jgi:hypothetical protein
MFNEVLKRIEPHMRHCNQVKAVNSSSAPIALKMRLAVTLRWLAGGSYLDLCFAWGVATSAFYHPDKVLWPTVEAIDAAFEIGLPVDDPLNLEDLARGFDEHSCGILKGCVYVAQNDRLKKLPEQYFFIGDEAFTNIAQFLSPWPGKLLSFYCSCHF